MPMFSIITPSYNSWKYMRRYWESLEQQTYEDFEIIIVDDCSNDDTFARLQAYVASSQLHIKLFRNDKNYGPGYTRNRGMQESSGEWITFVDSDDSVDIKLLEKAEAVIATNERAAVPITCIVYDYFAVHNDEKTYMSSMYGDHRGGIQTVSTCIAEVRNHVIGKFYRAENAKKISFPELKRCEDVAFVCQAIDACCIEEGKQVGCVYYLKEALYNYNQRPGSLSNDKRLDDTDMIKAYVIINNKLGKQYASEICSKSVPDLLYGVVLMMCKSGKSNVRIKRYILNYEKTYPQWSKSSIIKKLGKAKIFFLICVRLRWIAVLKLMSKIHSRMIG